MHCPPDLTDRPFSLTTEHHFALPAHLIYRAWTELLDVWFAAPGSVLMRAEENTVFYFETVAKFEKKNRTVRYPHYGRFLRLIPDRFIALTWVTGEGGTDGNETMIVIELFSQQTGTLLRLTHQGFPDDELREKHGEAWPLVLNQLESKMKAYIRGLE